MSDLQATHRPRHLPRLDSIRGLAMLLVFVYHLVGSAYPFRQDQLAWHGMLRDIHSAPSRSFLLFYPATFGWAGVCLFFVLSGFVIHYSTLTSSRPFSTGNFFWRRFRRIYPPYLIALVVFAGLKLASMRFHLSMIFARDFSLHLVLLQNLDPATFFGINGAFWSIATEVQFYLVYPLLLLLRGKIGMGSVLCIALGLSLVSCAAIALKGPEIGAEPITMTHALPVVTWFDWVLGAYIAEKFCSGQRWISLNIPLLMGLAVLTIASTLVKPASLLGFTLMSLLSAAVLERAVWAGGPLRKVERWLVRPGLCSYSFYLWHLPPLLVLAAVAKHLGISALPYVLIGGPLIYAGMYAFSWVLYLLVERPMEKRKPRSTPATEAPNLQSSSLDPEPATGDSAVMAAVRPMPSTAGATLRFARHLDGKA
jgi:peptidoglycan/LPS O-acetylase OafA/YrhL